MGGGGGVGGPLMLPASETRTNEPPGLFCLLEWTQTLPHFSFDPCSYSDCSISLQNRVGILIREINCHLGEVLPFNKP